MSNVETISAEKLGNVLPYFGLVIGRLANPVEFTRYCYHCDKEVTFCADRVCIAGLLGECLGCGELLIAPKSRMESEEA